MDGVADWFNSTVSGEITKALNIGQVVCVVQEVLENIFFSFICSRQGRPLLKTRICQASITYKNSFTSEEEELNGWVKWNKGRNSSTRVMENCLCWGFMIIPFKIDWFQCKHFMEAQRRIRHETSYGWSVAEVIGTQWRHQNELINGLSILPTNLTVVDLSSLQFWSSWMDKYYWDKINLNTGLFQRVQYFETH